MPYILMLALTLLSSTSLGAERIALVIGNADYRHASRLANPIGDAKATAVALRELGFDVQAHYDLALSEFQRVVRSFGRQARRAQAVVVYFAGHGLEDGQDNYLLPVDAKLEYRADIELEALALETLLKQIQNRQGYRLVMLDACRDNPLANGMRNPEGTRAVYRGLARVEPSYQTFVAYAAKHASKALDTDPRGSGHSPFTAALLAHLGKSLPLSQLFGTIREDVLARTDNRQEPWLYGAFGSQPIYLIPPNTLASPAKAILAIKAIPADARVRIMNVVPRYQDGIELTPGRYDIEVSAAGYQTYRNWHDLVAGEQVLNIELQQQVASVGATTIAQPAAVGRTGEVIRDLLRSGGEGPAMVFIQGGSFLMGSPEHERGRDDDERQNQVNVGDFYIGKYEVTFAEYDRFADATGRAKPDDAGWGRGQRPVINVSWYDAIAYAGWIGQETGKRYRLPTEAEWEYAARAGTQTPYHTGTTINPRQVNYSDTKTGKAVAVGRYGANAWGLYDVHGNVWEWTCSVYNTDYGGREKRCASKDEYGVRAYRGGSWGSRPRWARSAGRNKALPTDWNFHLGFRLAKSL